MGRKSNAGHRRPHGNSVTPSWRKQRKPQADPAARHGNGRSWSTCGACEKRTYPSKAAARAAGDEVQLWNDRHGIVPEKRDAVLRAYRCPAGTGGWHVGHSANYRQDLNDPALYSPVQAFARIEAAELDAELEDGL